MGKQKIKIIYCSKCGNIALANNNFLAGFILGAHDKGRSTHILSIREVDPTQVIVAVSTRITYPVAKIVREQLFGGQNG